MIIHYSIDQNINRFAGNKYCAGWYFTTEDESLDSPYITEAAALSAEQDYVRLLG